MPLILVVSISYASRMKSQANLDVLKESKEAYSKSIEEFELVCESQLYWSGAHVLVLRSIHHLVPHCR